MTVKVESYEDVPHMTTEDLQSYCAAHGESDVAKSLDRPTLVTRVRLLFMRGDGKTPSPEMPRSQSALSAALSPSTEGGEKAGKKAGKKKAAKKAMTQAEADAQMDAGEQDRIYPRCIKCAIAICDGSEVVTEAGTFCKEHASKSKAHSAQEGRNMKTNTAKKSTEKAGLKTKRDAKSTKAALKKSGKTVTRGAVAAGKKEAIGLDKYGFRNGSGMSKICEALHAGTTMEALRKIRGDAGIIVNDLKKKVGEKPWTRNAKITVNEKSGHMKMTSWDVPKDKQPEK
jgi:hypothetical protein